MATVARELGINEQTLGQWVNSLKARQVGSVEALSETERTELLRLRKDNTKLKLDRAFLKKRHSSSPRKQRIRTPSVRVDAPAEELLHDHPHRPAPRGLSLRLLRLVSSNALHQGVAPRADRGEGGVVPR